MSTVPLDRCNEHGVLDRGVSDQAHPDGERIESPRMLDRLAFPVQRGQQLQRPNEGAIGQFNDHAVTQHHLHPEIVEIGGSSCRRS